MQKKYLILFSFGIFQFLAAQSIDSLSTLSDTVLLSPIQATANLPITSEMVSYQQIAKQNLGQDMPILLKNTTSIVSSSDAGAGIGYTNMRIRGVGQNQINITLNGVPINDSESHGVFWVNMPDVSSSTQRVLIQRGVGTSSNGAAAFGASVNMETKNDTQQPFANGQVAIGSFNTQKYNLSAGSGDFGNGKWNVDGRISHINSDGYIDRASSDLTSFAVNAKFKPNENTEFHLMNLFGREITYQAWYGIDGQTLENDRTFNFAGAIYDENFNVIDFYNNQVDNYTQNHTHFYWNQQWKNGWKSKTTLHYTRGKGYFEEYVQDQNLADYLVQINETETADVVRRRWLDNHFAGMIFNLENQSLGNWDLFMNLAANHYIGDHFGEAIQVVGADNFTPSRYYNNQSKKTEISAFVKGLYQWNQWQLFGDVQYRFIDYAAEYLPNGQNDFENFFPFEDTFHFINPKAGINYKTRMGKWYLSYGMTHREPTRTDYLNDINQKPKAERLHDWEFGYRSNGNFRWGANLFYMRYNNQLVLTGQTDDVGNPIRENVGKSYRAGIELDAEWQPISKLKTFGNLAWSQHQNIDFTLENADGSLQNLGNTRIAYSPEWIGTLGIEFLPIENLGITLLHKYVSEQELTNFEAVDGFLDAYLVADLRLNYTPKFKSKTPLEFTLMINNLWNEQYENNGYYFGEPYYFPQAGRNFMLGVSFNL